MFNLRSLMLLVAAMATAAALPNTALAGGFTIPLVGARMSGQSVFVGYPDDTSAIYHNPAGLTLLKGYRVDVSALGIYSGTDYRRRPHRRRKKYLCSQLWSLPYPRRNRNRWASAIHS